MVWGKTVMHGEVAESRGAVHSRDDAISRFRIFLDLLFPPLCHCCRSHIRSAGRIHVCAECLKSSRPLWEPICTICGVPFATEGGNSHPCGRCLADKPPFAAARAPFVYEGAIRELIHRLKYEKKLQARLPLGMLVAERLAGFVEEAAPDLLIPVPLHLKRLRDRGFNQAILLGEILARQWHLPLERRVLRRSRWTEPQINLAAADRVANVKGAFEVSAPDLVKGRRIILVDDVLTTGSTVKECCRSLRKAGAGELFVVTAARVP